MLGPAACGFEAAKGRFGPVTALAQRLIERKRDGGRVEAGEWRALTRAYAAGHVPDYQMAAFLMAAYIRGLDRTETSALTDAMLASGATLDLTHLGIGRVDKHSTGGVGDKVSLVLAPLVASLGVAVPMMSGRGLGHTGGTLDKLESIPGFRTTLTLDEAKRQIERIGCALIGQSAEIAPVDRKMYALRDATSTVESIPLIAASIMSKKLAEGLTALVLDVKRGSGAFLPEIERGLAVTVGHGGAFAPNRFPHGVFAAPHHAGKTPPREADRRGRDQRFAVKGQRVRHRAVGGDFNGQFKVTIRRLDRDGFAKIGRTAEQGGYDER